VAFHQLAFRVDATNPVRVGVLPAAARLRYVRLYCRSHRAEATDGSFWQLFSVAGRLSYGVGHGILFRLLPGRPSTTMRRSELKVVGDRAAETRDRVAHLSRPGRALRFGTAMIPITLAWHAAARRAGAALAMNPIILLMDEPFSPHAQHAKSQENFCGSWIGRANADLGFITHSIDGHLLGDRIAVMTRPVSPQEILDMPFGPPARGGRDAG